MDESVAPSNTPQCNAVYDGCNYYYLPWSSEKPCVCVESYWENIAFRLEPLNALLRIIDRVVRLAIALISILIIQITISSLAIGLKMSYFSLIRLPSCHWIVCYWTVCYRTL